MIPETRAAHPVAAFLRRMAGFFDLVRSLGVPVGVGAELDLARALEHVSPLDRDRFRDAARCTLAKSPAEAALVDGAFDSYWSASSMEEIPSEKRRPTPTSEPPGGRIESISGPTMPMGTTVPIAVRLGVYSPEAPAGGHPLAPLDPRRLAAMRTGARRLRRAVASLPGRRSRPARRGRIDLRRTLRRAARTSGEWINLRHGRRRRTRAELLILWDVSASMRDHEAVLAAVVYSLRRLVRSTRVFAFSTEVRELTHSLSGLPYLTSLASLARALGPVGGGTQTGRCFREFRRGFGRLVHPWTTVVVLSDGWDLGDTGLLAREVAWLHEKGHRVVWVNPYAQDAGFRPETAGVEAALPHVDLFLAPSDFERPVGGLGNR